MGMMFCRGCGKEIHESASACPHCGAPQGVKSIPTSTMPDGIKGWSWGAFLLSGFWAIGNKTWIGLLAFVPYLGFIMAIVLGFQGREWAWKNREWDSVEHFNRVQKKWSFWGVTIIAGAFVVGLLAEIAIPVYQGYQHRAQEVAAAKQVDIERVANEAKEQAAAAETNSLANFNGEYVKGNGGVTVKQQDKQAEQTVATLTPAAETSHTPAICASIYKQEEVNHGDNDVQCSNLEFDEADKELNSTYKSIMGNLATDRKSVLKTEQVAWIKEKEKKCSAATEGAINFRQETTSKNQCLLEMTIQRTAYLVSFR